MLHKLYSKNWTIILVEGIVILTILITLVIEHHNIDKQTRPAKVGENKLITEHLWLEIGSQITSVCL